jgi:hypothetical protein
MPNAIEVPLGAKFTNEFLGIFFKPLKKKPNTLKHPVSRKFNRICHYCIDMDYKCALNW